MALSLQKGDVLLPFNLVWGWTIIRKYDRIYGVGSFLLFVLFDFCTTLDGIGDVVVL